MTQFQGKKILANEEAIEWMCEHAAEVVAEVAPHKIRRPVTRLADKAMYLFCEEQGLGCHGHYNSYLYYHQAAEVFKELGLDPGNNGIDHEMNYSAGCGRYH